MIQEMGLASETADFENTLLASRIVHPVNEIDVNNVGGLSHAKIYLRHQALTAGQNFTVVAILLEQGKRLIEGLGSVILERCRLQSIFLFLDFRIGGVDLAISSRKSLG